MSVTDRLFLWLRHVGAVRSPQVPVNVANRTASAPKSAAGSPATGHAAGPACAATVSAAEKLVPPTVPVTPCWFEAPPPHAAPTRARRASFRMVWLDIGRS